MKRQVRLLVLTLVSLAGAFSVKAGLAQTKTEGPKATVTGCLQKGDEVDEFSITGENGKTYQLRNSAVDLSKHVGHKVTIAGTFKAEKKEGESQEYGQKEASEVGTIRVTTLKKISDSCN